MTLVGSVQLVQGNIGSLEDIFGLLKRDGIETSANPDLYVREYSSFGVDDARDLSVRASSRALGNRRVFIIVASSMTSEAQNALLKTLEEPGGATLFFIVVPSAQNLLPTLRSRAQVLQIDSGAPSEALVDVTDFLKAGHAARLELLKPLLQKDEDDKRDLAPSLAFLSAIEQKLAQDPLKNRDGIEAIYRARKFIGDKGSLMKALLEQVAFLAG